MIGTERNTSSAFGLWWRVKINTKKKNTDVLLEATREVGLEVNVEKTKYESVSKSFRTGS
jgi:hypothetical protein